MALEPIRDEFAEYIQRDTLDGMVENGTGA